MQIPPTRIIYPKLICFNKKRRKKPPFLKTDSASAGIAAAVTIVICACIAAAAVSSEKRRTAGIAAEAKAAAVIYECKKDDDPEPAAAIIVIAAAVIAACTAAVTANKIEQNDQPKNIHKISSSKVFKVFPVSFKDYFILLSRSNFGDTFFILRLYLFWDPRRPHSFPYNCAEST